MREIKKIIVHCSASDYSHQDNVEAIKRLHTLPSNWTTDWGGYRAKGNDWNDIGYHWIITTDGKIHRGRSERIIGAHTKGHNRDSVGICVVGNKEFNQDQMDALHHLIELIIKGYNLTTDDVYPHWFFNPIKTCPNFNLGEKYGRFNKE